MFDVEFRDLMHRLFLKYSVSAHIAALLACVSNLILHPEVKICTTLGSIRLKNINAAAVHVCSFVWKRFDRKANQMWASLRKYSPLWIGQHRLSFGTLGTTTIRTIRLRLKNFSHTNFYLGLKKTFSPDPYSLFPVRSLAKALKQLNTWLDDRHALFVNAVKKTIYYKIHNWIINRLILVSFE